MTVFTVRESSGESRPLNIPRSLGPGFFLGLARVLMAHLVHLHAGRLHRETASLALVEQTGLFALSAADKSSADRATLSSTGRGNRLIGTARAHARPNQWQVSCGGCGPHGNCDTRSGTC